MQRKKILLIRYSFLVVGVLLITTFLLLISRVEAGSKKNIYLFSDGSYSVDVAYKENAQLVAVVGTKSNTLANVKNEIKCENGIIYINSLNEESLNIYSKKLDITGECSVNLLHAYCKTKIVNISVGGNFVYGTKNGKNITFGDSITEWENAYYCTTQVISDISDMNVVYDKNKKISLNAKLKTPSKGGGNLTYVSDDTSVVTVDTVGNLNIVGVGQTTVTITAAADGPYLATSKSITVKVNQAEQTITCDENATLTYGGQDVQISARTNGDGTLSYVSNNPKIVTVSSSGKLTATGAGNTDIVVSANATTNYKASEHVIKVTVVKAEQVILVSKKSYLKRKSKKTFPLNASLSGGTSLKYNSSNLNVLSVDNKGVVSIKDYGIATVTISADENSNYKAASNVTVSISVGTASTQITSISSTASNEVTLSWDKKADATGYNIEYSLDSTIPDNNKKTVSVSGETTISKTIKKLHSKKTYYFRVRPYVDANGSKVYSKFSAIKSAKVK